MFWGRSGSSSESGKITGSLGCVVSRGFGGCRGVFSSTVKGVLPSIVSSGPC